MLRKLIGLSVIFVFLLSMLTVTAYSAPAMATSNVSNTDTDANTLGYKIAKILYKFKENRFVDEGLYFTEKDTRVVAIVGSNIDISLLARHFKNIRFSPKIGSSYYLVGTLKPGDHSELLNNREVLVIFKDIPAIVPKDIIDLIGKVRHDGWRDLLKSKFYSKVVDVEGVPPNPFTKGGTSPKPAMYWAKSAVNVYDVWNKYGILGDGVTVAVVDTGVDYSSLGLGYEDIVARDSNGLVAAFDADATGIVFTNITVPAYPKNNSVLIPTTGLDPKIYILGEVASFSQLTNSTFPADMNVTGILSPGDIAHFGILAEWNQLNGINLFPILVIDGNLDGIYDTVYADLSFDWVFKNFTASQGYGPTEYDYSFADEKPLRADGWSIGGRDFNGDGIYDIGISTLAYGLDAYAVAPNIYDRGSILKPIDPYGNYTVFEYDWYGHGTSCADIIVGRAEPGLDGFSGIAPKAKLIGVDALYIGDIIEGWLWSSGFDLVPGTEEWRSVPGYGTVFGWWKYTGDHKANIISNSWGWSSWAYYFSAYHLPWYDVLTILEDALMMPGYLDPNYPGTVMVHAAGNGAPGYGTVTEPGYNTLAITVGAATSLESIAYYTHQLYGNQGYMGGYPDQVISWSARGPNAFGVVKPDILGIGAYGFTVGPIWFGSGNGLNTFTLFGGTSMATPVVAGVATLVLSAAKTKGISLIPEDVKVILKSTAKDLGYDSLTQGVGLVDAYKAVSTVLEGGLTISSSATYRNLFTKLWRDPWLFAHAYSSGYNLSAMPPSQPIFDTSWYAGDLLPGESSNAVFKVSNTHDKPESILISAVRYKLIKQVSFTLTTENYTWLGNTYLGYLLPINKSSIPSDTDLMVVSSNITMNIFDSDRNYTSNNEIFLYMFDWKDLNGDGVPQSNESIYVAYSAADGTTEEIKVGRPLETFQYTPLLRVRQYPVEGPLKPINVTIIISYLKRVPWSWISFDHTSLTIGPGKTALFTARITIPKNASQGLYHGFVLVKDSSEGHVLSIPLTVNVFETVSSQGLNASLTVANTDPLYSPDEVKGYFDWGWRAESGDWRIWNIRLLGSPSLIGAFVVAHWKSNATDIDLMTFDKRGWMLDGSEYTRLYGGAFEWYTRTSTSMEYASLSPTEGYYRVLLHNILLDGSVYPEKVSGELRFTHLQSYGLTKEKSTNNTVTVSKSFKLDSGLTLTNVNITLYSVPENITVSVEPSVFDVTEYSSQVFTVKVTVPKDMATSVYHIYLQLTADQFPYKVILDIPIDVKKTLFPLTVEAVSNVGPVVLQLSSEAGGTLTLTSQNMSFTLNVTKIVYGKHVTFVFLEMNYNIKGEDNWIKATLIINRDYVYAVFYSQPIYFVGSYK